MAIDTTIAARYLCGMDQESRRTILVIDLEREQSERIMLTEVQARRTLGGKLLALQLWRHYKDDANLASAAYEAGNPFVIASASAAELDLALPSSVVMVTRNPTTAGIATSPGSSTLARGILGCGYLAVVLIGRMRRLGGIIIDESTVRFVSAEEHHNSGTIAVGKRVGLSHLIVAGPAADQGSPYASLSVNGTNVGQGGVGTVLGRKNVKYIGFTPPSEGRECQDTKLGGRFNRRLMQRQRHSSCARAIARHGDLALIARANTHGWAAIEGWTYRVDGRLWALSEKMESFDHPIPLAHCLALGPNLGFFETKAIARLNRRCLDNGLDPVSISALLIWARKSREDGLLVGVPDLRNPDIALMERLLDSIAYRRGGGGIELSYPLDELVNRHGGSSHAYLVGKRPIAPFDLRALPATALLTALGDETVVYGELVGGNRYRRGWERNLAQRARFAQVLNASACCVGIHPTALIDLAGQRHLFGKRRSFLLLATAATLAEGRPISIRQIIDYGRAALDLEQTINDELGSTVSPHLPERVLIDGKSHFHTAQVVPLARLLDAYRSLRAMERHRDPSPSR